MDEMCRALKAMGNPVSKLPHCDVVFTGDTVVERADSDDSKRVGILD